MFRKIVVLEKLKMFKKDKFALPEKCPYSEFFWSDFPAFGLDTEWYAVSLRLQSECGKIWNRKTPNMDTFYAVLVTLDSYHTGQKMKFLIKDFFSKCDQLRRKLRAWWHLLKKSLMTEFIFCAMYWSESKGLQETLGHCCHFKNKK